MKGPISGSKRAMYMQTFLKARKNDDCSAENRHRSERSHHEKDDVMEKVERAASLPLNKEEKTFMQHLLKKGLLRAPYTSWTSRTW